jgi:hypothetical protein
MLFPALYELAKAACFMLLCLAAAVKWLAS